MLQSRNKQTIMSFIFYTSNFLLTKQIKCKWLKAYNTYRLDSIEDSTYKTFFNHIKLSEVTNLILV